MTVDLKQDMISMYTARNNDRKAVIETGELICRPNGGWKVEVRLVKVDLKDPNKELDIKFFKKL